LKYILELKFTPDEISYLRGLEIFNKTNPLFFDYLSNLKFSGTVRSIPEGSFIFPNEPVLEITAPVIEAQILETALLSIINFETMVASKAARVVTAARGRAVIEFGARRAHGPGAAVAGARAACIAGCIGTSNLEAGMLYGIPVYGTIAHSFIMAHDDELKAYQDFAQTFPENVVLLIDTYDTLEGARLAAKLGDIVKAVRLASGDLFSLSLEVRKILDSAGLQKTKIMASGDLNETKINDLMKANVPIDIFGVGSELITSKDAPTMTGVYKLVETEENSKRHFRIKLSKDKVTLPGRKQVYRKENPDGKYSGDIIATEGEFDNVTELKPLLETYIKNGHLIRESISFDDAREVFKNEMDKFSIEVTRIEQPIKYDVQLSTGMKSRLAFATHEHEAGS
jgi:nicotinate phosphoribosyltransferase